MKSLLTFALLLFSLYASAQPPGSQTPAQGAGMATVVADLVERADQSRSPRGKVVARGKLGRKLDGYLQKQFEAGFSGAALVVERGKIVLHKGYGFADREKDILNRPETVFSIGSITKDFTLAAILKLEEDGRLSVDDPIALHLENVPQDKRSITIHHLMRHESGLQEYHDRGEFEYLTYDQAMERILGQALRFEPGTDQGYSNSGYALLAAIIEKASGVNYKDYILQSVIRPASLPNAAFYSQRERMREDLIALGYDGRQFGERNSPYYWVASWQNMGSGGLVLTLKELYDWRIALEKGKILGPGAKQKFLEVYNPPTPTPWAGPVRAFAGGNDHGFNMIYLEMPEHDAFILLASNTMYRRAERFVRPFAQLYLGQEVEYPEPPSTTPFVPREAEAWGLPPTPAGKTAALWLNALCGEDDAAREDFIQNRFGDALRERRPAKEHLDFFRTIYNFLATTPEIQEITTENETTISFRMHSAQTGERIKVEMVVEAQAPHQVLSILVGD